MKEYKKFKKDDFALGKPISLSQEVALLKKDVNINATDVDGNTQNIKENKKQIDINKKQIGINKTDITSLDDNKINSFYGANELDVDTHKIEGGDIINSDFNNKQLSTKNKWGKGAINELFDKIEENILDIILNWQILLKHKNLFKLIFDILNKNTTAYVKSHTIKGTYYIPEYIATSKNKNEVSEPSILTQINNKQHKIFSGFDGTLGVTMVIVTNKSSIGDVNFTLLRDGVKIGETITKTLTGKKMSMSVIFENYPFVDDKKDHIYMIESRGVDGAWYDINYLGLEFTLLGAGGSGGGGASVDFVIKENERQDKEHQLKLDNKFIRFTDSDNGRESIKFDPNSYAVNGGYELYPTEVWNPRIEGKNLVNFVLATREIVDNDRVKIDFMWENDYDLMTYGDNVISNISFLPDYTITKNFDMTGNIYSAIGISPNRFLNEWFGDKLLFFIHYNKNERINSVQYYGDFESSNDIVIKDNLQTQVFILKKEINKINKINKTDDEVVNEILHSIEKGADIGKLFAKHIKLRKEKKNVIIN